MTGVTGVGLSIYPPGFARKTNHQLHLSGSCQFRCDRRPRPVSWMKRNPHVLALHYACVEKTSSMNDHSRPPPRYLHTKLMGHDQQAGANPFGSRARTESI